MDSKKDIHWIDWTKFICMFFVYWCHIDQLGTNNFAFFVPYGLFFVNSFFFISGYLIFKKQLRLPFITDKYLFVKMQFGDDGMLPNILYKIAIPSILFSMIDYIPKTIVRGGSFSFGTFVYDTMLRGTNWFTCALCVSELIIFVFLILRKRNVWFYLFLSIPIFILGNSLNINHFVIWGDEYFPWFYKNGFAACLLITLGGVYNNYEDFLDRHIKKVGGSYFAIVLFLICCVIEIKEPWGAINASVQRGFNFSGVLFTLLSIISLIYICKSFCQNNFAKFVSRHSIGFFFLSASIPFVWCRITESCLPSGSVSFIIGVIGSFITSLIVVFLLNKFIPFVFDLRKLINK